LSGKNAGAEFRGALFGYKGVVVADYCQLCEIKTKIIEKEKVAICSSAKKKKVIDIILQWGYNLLDKGIIENEKKLWCFTFGILCSWYMYRTRAGKNMEGNR
jgi:hypothetical protein